MSNIKVMRLLGFSDFFGGQPSPRETYAIPVGKDDIQRLCCLMLTYCKRGHTPSVLNLLRLWFTYRDRSYEESLAYVTLYEEYRRIARRYGHDGIYILSEEALLNLYIWATQNEDIPDHVEHADGSFMVSLFQLLLCFNNDVLTNFYKADVSARKYDDLVAMRRVLAERFPQNDLINIDYGKLVYTQIYKLMELLNFLENHEKYQALYQHFLNDFGCSTKEEFFKALGGAVIIPLNPNKTGINSLVLDETEAAQRSGAFLDKLVFQPGDVDLGPTDYKFLRDKPLQKLPDEYRVVFDFFLIKKLYNGIVFKLSGYVNEDKTLFKGPLFGSLRDEFSEAVLLYRTLDTALNLPGVIKITGNQFKTAGLQREPDYYYRQDHRVLLFESKDFFMTAELKLSYDFDVISGGLLADGRLGKGVLQLATNTGRVIQQTLPMDNAYDPLLVEVFPVLIVHDSLYNSPSLNFWINRWFQEQLMTLSQRAEFHGVDFSRVRPVTLIDIDTLILYRANFESGELDLSALLESYHQYVRFAEVGEEFDQRYTAALLPFSDYVRYEIEQRGLAVNLELIQNLYVASGYID